MTRTAATLGPVDKNKIVYQSGRGASLYARLPLAHFPYNFASGVEYGRTPDTATAGLWGVTVPHDLRIDEIKMYIKEQGAGTTRIDVHKSSGAYLSPVTVFSTQGNRPSITAARSFASGAVADAIPDDTLWLEDDKVFVYVDEAATGPSGLYVEAVGRFDTVTT